MTALSFKGLIIDGVQSYICYNCTNGNYSRHVKCTTVANTQQTFYDFLLYSSGSSNCTVQSQKSTTNYLR